MLHLIGLALAATFLGPIARAETPVLTAGPEALQIAFAPATRASLENGQARKGAPLPGDLVFRLPSRTGQCEFDLIVTPTGSDLAASFTGGSELRLNDSRLGAKSKAFRFPCGQFAGTEIVRIPFTWTVPSKSQVAASLEAEVRIRSLPSGAASRGFSSVVVRIADTGSLSYGNVVVSDEEQDRRLRTDLKFRRKHLFADPARTLPADESILRSVDSREVESATLQAQ